MKAECCLKSATRTSERVENKTKCTICKSTVFKVNRITPELIMLTCENCGEPHMLGINSDESGVRLTFWSQETGVDD